MRAVTVRERVGALWGVVADRGGALVESIVVGWADDGRAQVFLPKGVCASGARRPGLYLVPIDGAPELSRSETVGPGP